MDEQMPKARSEDATDGPTALGPAVPVALVAQRLRRSIRQRFADDALAEAAYQVVSSAESAGRPPAPDSTVGRLLTQLECFSALDVREEHPAHRIRRRIAPLIQDPAAVAIYLLRALHRVCDADLFGVWTRAFVRAPAPLPSAARSSVPIHGVATDRLERVIAPLARFWGAWEEYRVARAVALLIDEPEQFDAMVDFAERHARPGGRCEALNAQVAGLIADQRGCAAPIWEWHNVATIADVLRTDGRHEPDKHLALCGFVTVRCATVADCYAVLARLHAHARHLQHEFRDWMGQAQRPHYRAIHTVLELALPEGHRSVVKVRLLLEADAHRQDAQVSLETIRQRLDAIERGSGTMKVFSRGMKEIKVDVGATVLDFALALSRSWVGRAASARVNGAPVGLDHPLKPADTVELVELSAREDIEPLPEGWARDRDADCQRRMQSAWEQSLKSALRMRGRHWMQRRLIHLAGVQLPIRVAEGILEATLASVAMQVRGGGRTSAPMWRNLKFELGWWLAELGKHAAMREGLFWDQPIAAAALTEADLLGLDRDLSDTVERIQTRQPIANLPSRARGVLFHGVKRCRCLGRERVPLGISNRKGQGIALHAHGSACESVLFDAPPIRRNIEFIVTAEVREGILRDVSGVFNTAQASMGAVSAASLNGTGSVVRVRLASRYARDDDLVTQLEAVPGVRQVYGPGDDPPAELRRAVPLPPASRHHAPSAPFTSGPPVEEPEHFYGRERALAQLDAWADEARSSSLRGRLISVRGPHRVGKSSVVVQWLRHLRGGSAPVACAYVEAEPTVPWETLRARLLNHVRQSVQAFMGGPDPAPAANLITLGAQVRAQDGLLALVIDEAPALLKEIAKSEAQLASFAAFVQVVRRTPGMVLVTVGPDLPFEALPERCRSLFRDACLLIVGPLSEADTVDLISARRSQRVHPARVAREVALRVHDWADGDACFSAAIVREMYVAALDGSPGPPVMRLEGVLPAVSTVVSQRQEMFSNRIRAVGWHCRRNPDQLPLCKRIIAAFVDRWDRDRSERHHRPRLRDCRPHLDTRVQRGLSTEFDAKALREMYGVMARAGVISRLEVRGDGRILSMTPLMAEYISEYTPIVLRNLEAPKGDG